MAHDGAIHALAFTKDGELLASAAADGKVGGRALILCTKALRFFCICPLHHDLYIITSRIVFAYLRLVTTVYRSKCGECRQESATNCSTPPISLP